MDLLLNVSQKKEQIDNVNTRVNTISTEISDTKSKIVNTDHINVDINDEVTAALDSSNDNSPTITQGASKSD